ncbi:hypothetical protein FQR65_LT10945 [Abscondita terminalis]|nr:hypothetical protein FQR65_LT10945 [Abscondita terminalis]
MMCFIGCQPQDITVYLKQGSPPVINPDKSKIPKSFFNFSRPMEKLEFKSSGEPGYINVTSPIGGSYFASAFISYTDPNFQAITQQGLTPNCDTVITTTLFVNRALKPIMAVPDMDTDVLLESNTAKVYKFHVFDVIDDTILFLNNIDFCDDCTELDVHVQSNRIPLNEFLYSANLKKTDYDNKSYMFRIMTAEDSWYYVSFNMHAKNGTKARSHFEFKFTYFYLPNNDHEEFINVSKNGTGIGNVKFKRATLRDYQSQRIDHPVMYKQYDLMRSSHTESFLYSFDLSSDDDVLPVPVNITNEDMVILKFHVTPGVDIGGTLQFGLAFKPRIRKDGKNVKIIEEPKNHTLIGCLKNNAKEIPTWPNKCSLLGEQSNAAVILNGTVKNGTILVPFPESGNWYASLKLFCGECKPCKCPEMCKKQYRTCYTKCETSCTSIKNCSSCVEGCEQLIISKRGCETCDCDGPCQKSKVFCNSSILFEVSSYPCINGQCGVNGKCMYMVTEGFSYSVCFCMNKYKGWDCSDDSAAKSKGMIILELLLLVLSNLAFLPAVYVAYRRHYYVEAVVYFSTFFFSSFYHACDAGENIYTFCMMYDDWDESSPIVTTQFTNNAVYSRGGGGHRSRGISRLQNNYNNSSGSNNWRNPKTENGNYVSMEVPTKCVGRIIGKGGSKISDLQYESGAKITVTKEITGDNTVVKISGLETEISKAREMIEQLTIERPPRQEKNFFTSAPAPAPASFEIPDIDWKALAEECDQYTKDKWSKAPPMKKDFYIEDPEVAKMSAEQVAQFRENNNNIVVSRVLQKTNELKPIPNPVKTFEQAFRHYPLILNEIKKAGFETPSPIQSQGWPVLLSGEDLIGIAQTGTGKTLAFLLPALIHIDGQPTPRAERDGPSVLVIAPTRELALQIEREVKKYHYKDIKAVCVYGGGNRKEQVNIVTDGVDIIIATPGRLNDLVLAGYISLKYITYIVLDEADRMLDMGFEPQIRKVLYDVRPDRQTVMTSATWPPGVRRLADSYMDNPIQVYVGSLDLAAVHTVIQTILMLPDEEEEKFRTFMEFAANMQDDEKAIVFCGKKTRADYLASELVINGIDCQSIHGDREQCDREQALADITDGTVQILIATDVASRGLDIEDITHVINYDFPRNIEEYVHRVGRTGRAGRSGHSISYFTRADWASASELIPILQEANQSRMQSKRGLPYGPPATFFMSFDINGLKNRVQIMCVHVFIMPAANIDRFLNPNSAGNIELPA